MSIDLGRSLVFPPINFEKEPLPITIVEFLSAKERVKCLRVSKVWKKYFSENFNSHARELKKFGYKLTGNQLNKIAIFGVNEFTEKIKLLHSQLPISCDGLFRCNFAYQNSSFEIAITQRLNKIHVNGVKEMNCLFLDPSKSLMIDYAGVEIPVREKADQTLTYSQILPDYFNKNKTYYYTVAIKGDVPIRADQNINYSQKDKIEDIVKIYQNTSASLKFQLQKFFPYLKCIFGEDFFEKFRASQLELRLPKYLSTDQINNLEVLAHEQARIAKIIDDIFNISGMDVKFFQLEKKLSDLFKSEQGKKWHNDFKDFFVECVQLWDEIQVEKIKVDDLLIHFYELFLIKYFSYDEILKINEDDLNPNELIKEIGEMIRPILEMNRSEPRFQKMVFTNEIISIKDIFKICSDISKPHIEGIKKEALKYAPSISCKILYGVKDVYSYFNNLVSKNEMLGPLLLVSIFSTSVFLLGPPELGKPFCNSYIGDF